MAEGIFSWIVDAVSNGNANKVRPLMTAPMLSDWLPYRSYDPDRKLYLNSNSNGFILRVAPMLGADERIGDILSQFLSESIPSGCSIQLLNYASPSVRPILNKWHLERLKRNNLEGAKIYSRLASHRLDKLVAGAWDSLSKDGPFFLRDFRVYLSVSIPTNVRVPFEEIDSLRETMKSMLSSINIDCNDVPPDQLIALLDDMLSPTTNNGENIHDYNPMDTICDQALRHDVGFVVSQDKINIQTPPLRASGHINDNVPEMEEITPDKFDVRSFTVRNMPRYFAPWDAAKLVGDPFSDKLRLPCPTATIVSMHYPDEESANSKAGMKFMRTTSLADSKSARFLPQLAEQSNEWKFVKEKLETGNKLVKFYYGITLFARQGDGDKAERSLKSLYKAQGWDIIKPRYLQSLGLMAALPLSAGNGISGDLGRMRLTKTQLSTTVANLLPFYGEYLGGDLPHMLFVGRRGQPFYWSPFENKAGNHNVAVFGKSGSGKSVLLQDLCTSMASVGAKVIVIDDGRSFQHMCEIQGGNHVVPTIGSGFCLNLFDMIDSKLCEADEDYKIECLTMLRTIVAQMARFVGTTNDSERGIIDETVNAVWNEHGNAGTIDHIIERLNVEGDFAGQDLARSLQPYSATGTYGKFFIGKTTFKVDGDLTVFELSDLASKEELRSVVLTAIMFLSSQVMRSDDRARRKVMMIDEAWQLLKGGAMADFVESYARTCRKYGGSLVTATQSLDDYYKSDGSRAALENSDWTVVLQQKPETIEGLSKSGRFELNPYTDALLRSLKRNGIEYSDVFIRGPEMEAVGRLVLDPYSGVLYSSSPDVFNEVDQFVAGGHPVEEAIELVSQGKKYQEPDGAYQTPTLEAAE